MTDSTVYYVIGAEYRDTDFRELVPGTGEIYGPYDKSAADKKWQQMSMSRVDECMIRYRVVDRDRLVALNDHVIGKEGIEQARMGQDRLAFSVPVRGPRIAG